eukprot:scaffold157784_cov23-Tisochrysis_lutea.AAC.3
MDNRSLKGEQPLDKGFCHTLCSQCAWWNEWMHQRSDEHARQCSSKRQRWMGCRWLKSTHSLTAQIGSPGKPIRTHYPQAPRTSTCEAHMHRHKQG